MNAFKLSVLGYLFTLAFHPVLAQDWTNFPIEKKKISPNVIFYKTGETSVNTNMVAIKTSSGIVMIDAVEVPEVASKVRQMAESGFKNKVTYLINTHGANDHTGGNSAFSDVHMIGQTTIRDEITRFTNMTKMPQFQENWQKGMIHRLDSTRATFSGDKREIDESIEKAKYLLEKVKNNSFNAIIPDSLFKDSLTLSIGEVTLKMYHNTPSYSGSDIIIYIPKEKMLIVGDIFNKQRLPLVNTQTNLDQWEQLFARYISKNSDVKYFIGGHGDIMTKDEIIEQLNYLRKLFEEVGKLKKEGKTAVETRQALDLKTFPYLNTYRTNFYGTDMNIHWANIMMIWKQLK